MPQRIVSSQGRHIPTAGCFFKACLKSAAHPSRQGRRRRETSSFPPLHLPCAVSTQDARRHSTDAKEKGRSSTRSARIPAPLVSCIRERFVWRKNVLAFFLRNSVRSIGLAWKYGPQAFHPQKEDAVRAGRSQSTSWMKALMNRLVQLEVYDTNHTVSIQYSPRRIYD